MLLRQACRSQWERTRCSAFWATAPRMFCSVDSGNRRAQKLLERMQALTLKTILRKRPGVRRSK